MLKIGLIGAGFMGKKHLACYKLLEKEFDVKVTAIADVRPEFAKAAADDIKADTYENGMALIEKSGVDMVDICLPTYLHASHAIAAMEAGKNVFLEKPVCINEKEGKLLLETEKKTGAKVMIGQCIRLWDEYAWVKEAVEKKTYGKLVSGSFQRLSPRPGWAWEDWVNQVDKGGTGALDMHIHDVDYVRYLFGEPEKVSATAARDENGVLQQIFAAYEFGDGSSAAAEYCWDYPKDFPFAMTFRVKCEKATMVFGSGFKVYPKDGEPFTPEFRSVESADDKSGGNVSSLGGYYNELKYFLNGQINGAPLTVAPLSEGIKSVELCLREIEIAGGAVKK